MLKCPKCGGDYERLESFSGGFLKCKSCGNDLWLNDIVERCEKAEAELQELKERNKELQEEVEEYVFEDFYEHAYQRKSDGLYYTGGLSNNETTYTWLCNNGYMKAREDGLFELTDKKRGGE